MNTPHPKKVDKHHRAGGVRAQDLGNIDLYEEEISAEKHLRDLGEVQLSKRVVVSKKEITVPVMHEELTVERTPLERPTVAAPAAITSSFDELRIPLYEEEAAAEKYTKPLGEVRLHKRVALTEKQITVPVMHEELRVERAPATERMPIAYADGMFEEKAFVVPLHEEEVEIHLRPVIREGVRLTKTSVEESVKTSTDLRREELDIEEPTLSAHAWRESRDPHDFTDDDQVIPLFKEEIEIRKYPVLREEVRVNRAALQEERTATTEAFKDELDVERAGDPDGELL